MFATGDTVADKYRIERLLGRGGMGAVYAAEHLLLQQRVAIKVIAADVAGPGHRERFLREARAASRVRSEHVTQVFDVGELPDGTIFMVLELLDGHDLAELRQDGVGEPSEAVAVVLEALVGVAAAHASGVVHRDLKLENLFLARRPNGSVCVKVLDFGISKSLGEAKSITASGTMVGSPYSMSPEQIRDAKSVDARTDVWSMGVVLYVLLCGEEPFEGDDVGAVLAAILEGKPKPVCERRSGIDPALSAVVDRALSKDRRERHANVADLADELAPFGGARGPALAADVRRVLGVSGVATIDPGKSRRRPAEAKPREGAEDLSTSDTALSATRPSGDQAIARSGDPPTSSMGDLASGPSISSDAPKRRSDATVAGVPFERAPRSSPLLWVGILCGFVVAGILALVGGGRASPSNAASASAAASDTKHLVDAPRPSETSSPPATVVTPSESATPTTPTSATAAPTDAVSARLPVSKGGVPPARRTSSTAAPSAPAVTAAPTSTPAAPSSDVLFNQGRQ